MKASQIVCGCALLLFSSVGWAASAAVPHGTVELIAKQSSIQPGQPFTVGLNFHLEKGWHVYWKNPGDSGLPPRVKWDLPSGLQAGEIEWPAPKRLPVGPLLDYGYENQVLLPIPFQTESNLTGNTAELKGHLRVLVCRETCIPGTAELALTIPVSKSGTLNPKTKGLFAAAEAQIPKPAPAGWQVKANGNKDQILLTVNGPASANDVAFYPATPNVINNAAPQIVKAVDGGLSLTLKRADDAVATAELAGLLSVGGSSAATYAISTPLALPTGAGPSSAGTPSAVPADVAPAAVAGQSAAAMLLFAFLGGLILNLMPCVFPVLSIKVLSVLKSADEGSRPKANALTYAAGILVSFWLLVSVLLVLRSAGGKLGWGFQLQSPGFVAFLICFLFLFGLNLAGVFEIGQSLMGAGGGLAQRQGLSGSFFTGVLATVVATPCTAPFMGTAIAFALGQPAITCFAVFTSMAIGLSLPFLVMAYVPALARVLPRPGRWMETLKHFMAFPVFATVIWLLWVLGLQASVDGLVRLLIALLVIAMAVWIYARWAGSRIATALGMVLVAAAFVYAVREGQAAQRRSVVMAAETNGRSAPGWEAFTPQKFKEYRAAGKPVLIDFTAAWCLTCQVNEHVAFGSQEVRDRLKQGKLALLRADWTSYDPGITDTLASYGRSGVPLYVIYGPGTTDKPVLLPDGVFGPSTVLHALDDLKL